MQPSCQPGSCDVFLQAIPDCGTIFSLVCVQTCRYRHAAAAAEPAFCLLPYLRPAASQCRSFKYRPASCVVEGPCWLLCVACRLQFPVVTSPVPRGAISGWPSWTACQNVQVRNTVWAQEAEMHRTERVLARCCFCCGGSSHCFICMAASVGAYIQRVAMILATHMYIFNFFIRRLSLISSLFFCCIFFFLDITLSLISLLVIYWFKKVFHLHQLII